MRRRVLWSHRDRHLSVEWPIDDFELGWKIDCCTHSSKVQSPKSKVLVPMLRDDIGRSTLDIGLFEAVRLITAQGKVFSQRMTFPVIGQQYSSQIRMAVKDDSHQ